LWEKIEKRVVEIKLLRKVFGSKRDEITGECRRLNNEELYGMYSTPRIIQHQKNEMVWYVACVSEEQRCMLGLGGEA
jgi:hypothetical protein